MAHPLAAADLKIGRSREHFESLAAETDAFFQGDPYETVSHFDEDKGERIYRLVARKEVPPRIGLLTGECLQQLRSALDHIAWQLALLNTPCPPTSTEFPVFKDATGKNSYASNRDKKIGAIPPAAQAVIDEMQPHRQAAPEEDLVWILHRLANEDKHRLPHVVAAVPQGLVVARPPGIDLFIWLHHGPFDDDTEVAGVKIHPPNDPRMEVNPKIGPLIMCFDPSSPARGRAVLPLLVELGKGLDATIAEFSKFFP